MAGPLKSTRISDRKASPNSIFFLGSQQTRRFPLEKRGLLLNTYRKPHVGRFSLPGILHPHALREVGSLPGAAPHTVLRLGAGNASGGRGWFCFLPLTHGVGKNEKPILYGSVSQNRGGEQPILYGSVSQNREGDGVEKARKTNPLWVSINIWEAMGWKNTRHMYY